MYSELFRVAFSSHNIQLLIDEFLNFEFLKTESEVVLAVEKVQAILIEAANHALLNIISEKWFDKKCRLKKHDVRKLANLKH